MVSQFDQEEDEELDAWSDEEAEPQASCRGSNTLVRKYEGVKRQLDNLRKTFRLYHRRVSRFERRTGKKITKHLPLPEEEVRPSTSRGPQQRPGGRPHAAGRHPPSSRAGEPRSGRTRQREFRRSVATPSSPVSSAPSSALPPPSRPSLPPSRPSPLPSRQSPLTSRQSCPRPSSKRAREPRSWRTREARLKPICPSPLSSPSSSSSSSASSSPLPPPSHRSPPPSRRSPSPSRRSPSPCDPSPTPPTAGLRLSPTPSLPSSPPPPPSRRPSMVKTPPVAASQSSVAPSSGRREGADSPPPKKRSRSTHHTGGSPPPEESPEESRPPRKETSRRNPASLLSGFSSRMG
ncbi:vegetative cell wall protein gp1-like [Nothobranchius furzeri]|uniref:Vegetative cell wall protein gp1-like n=1 Tax=Nothobranchius furzeri TaxID=105023 RepID=A0A9D2XCW9_NOTFU|nr:vegetative cell wall protein gp1-like [Nothobranchius furzeri]